MSKFQALDELFGLKDFTKDDIYDNLELLSENKLEIEKKLFKQRYRDSVPRLFLYDVTSSYLEGEQNHYAAYGYNRDKKSGKQQIVIGLLTDESGVPVASRIFAGNTSDSSTVEEQIRTLTDEFGISEAIMVGDRAMFKLPQLELLPDNFKYITAINKSQIEKLVKVGKLQYELFEEELSEITIENDRYILRRNPTRALEIEETRAQKLEKLNKLVQAKNDYLVMHSRAKIETAHRLLCESLEKYKLDDYVSIGYESRKLFLSVDENKLKEISRLDGCYCIKTDVPSDCSKETIHARYKDLSKVEFAFKHMKTEYLELRPFYVRKQCSTDAHVLITMLAYMIVQRLELIWCNEKLKVSEALNLLDRIAYQTVVANKITTIKIPLPNETMLRLLQLAKVTLHPTKTKKAK